MSVLATIAAASEEGGTHVVNELFMPAPMFGAVALTILTVLGLVTFTFRDVSNRHAAKAAAYAREHGESAAH